MAMKLSFSKLKNPKSILSRLPRFNLDLRINNMKIELLYTPVMETLVRVWKEKKGIVEISAKQFSEFKKPTSKKSKQIKRKATK
jgi:hypothetical protein